MKPQKYFLVSAVFTAILCVLLLGEVEPDLPNGTLLGQPNPALAGIDKLYLWIIPHDFELDRYGLASEKLESSVIDKIEKDCITNTETNPDKTGADSEAMLKVLEKKIDPANIKNLKFKPYRIPELRIDIDTLDIESSQQVAFHVQLSLARLVHLQKKTGLAFKTNVWQSEPVMQTVSEENLSTAVTNVVLEQVEEFIHAYLAANPPAKQASDESDIGTVPKEQPKPAVKSTPASQQGEPTEYKYVASKNSNVFHNPDCSSAKRIKPENLVGYNSREDAINAGKRPCKRCKP